MAQMREQPTMPPQERAQVEAMLRQSGLGLPASAGAPTTLRVCLTPDDAARGLSRDKALKGRMVTTTVKGGKAERVDMATEATWLGADCGAITSRTQRLPTR